MSGPSGKRLIGVLGGMGPAATVDFLAKVVAATPATCDQDHVPMVVYNVPQIPSRVKAIAKGSDAPLEAMIAGLRVLEGAGAEILAIPCNTAHYWYDQLARETRLPIIHIADAVREALDAGPGGTRRLAIMATVETMEAGVYRDRLAAAGLELMRPDSAAQSRIDRAIHAVKIADAATARREASTAAEALLAAGADGLLLACTELPVALAGEPVLGRAIDATDALARACVAASLSDHACFETPLRRSSA